MAEPNYAMIRHRKVVNDMEAYRQAVMFDRPLTVDEAREHWDDVFLTNVMVPVLENIKRVLSEDLEEVKISNHAAEIERLSVIVRAIDITQEALHEWRG